jgi:hypothetical protein
MRVERQTLFDALLALAFSCACFSLIASHVYDGDSRRLETQTHVCVSPLGAANQETAQKAKMKRRPTRRLHLRAHRQSLTQILHVASDGAEHIPVSHVDVLSIMDKEIVPVAIVRRRCAVSKGRRCDDAEAWRVILPVDHLGFVPHLAKHRRRLSFLDGCIY